VKDASERGAALITVLLLVAVMSALIAVSFDRLGLALRRERNRSTAEEVRLDMISSEAIALDRITQLQSIDQAKTPVGAAWQDVPVSVPIPGGQIIARLRDGGNCFNLNSLVTTQPDGTFSAQPAAISQLSRLLELSGVTTSDAGSIAVSAADWIDSDTLPQPGGREDEGYTKLAVPYRTGNGIMQDAGELRAVAGMTPDLFARLKPLLCAYPETILSGYNVNTLTARQAPLVAAMFPSGVTSEMVLAALRNRPVNGFGAVQDFLTQPSLRTAGSSGLATVQLRLRSSWFSLELMARLNDSDFSETALIDGRFQPARLVRRSYGEY
jgi:general secretion pathway protein K